VIGTLLTGVFAAVSLGGTGFPVQQSMGAQIGVQALGVVVALAWCGGLSWLILKLMDVVFGLRVSEEKETEGLDLAEHGERGYSP
jgi:Amt family ammonium transporter